MIRTSMSTRVVCRQGCDDSAILSPGSLPQHELMEAIPPRLLFVPRPTSGMHLLVFLFVQVRRHMPELVRSGHAQQQRHLQRRLVLPALRVRRQWRQLGQLPQRRHCRSADRGLCLASDASALRHAVMLVCCASSASRDFVRATVLLECAVTAPTLQGTA